MKPIFYFVILLLAALHSEAQSTLKIVNKNNKEFVVNIKGSYIDIAENGSNITFVNMQPDVYEISFYKSKLMMIPAKVINISLIDGYKTTLLIDDKFNILKRDNALGGYHYRTEPQENAFVTEEYYPPQNNIPAEMFNMNDDDLDILVRDINNKPFGDDKLKIAKIRTKSTYFYTEQVIKILNAFGPFNADKKLTLAKEIFPRVFDKHNYYKVADVFTFSSEKKELLNFIELQ